MSTYPSEQLAEELASLYAVKIALILVPVRRLLQAADRQELATAIDRLVGECTLDIRTVLTPYEITRKN